MGSLSNYSENELLDHIFNAAYSPVATVYLALSTADIGEDGSGLAEPLTANGYARKAITFAAAASRKVTQTGAVTFDTATDSWGTITHWGIYDSGTRAAGNCLAYGAFTSSFAPVAGNAPTISDTSVYVQINTTTGGAGFTDYAVHNLLNLMFRNVAFSKPSTYIALCAAVVADDSTSITEQSGTGYARKQVNINGGSSPTWDLASGGALDNTHEITLDPPSANDWDEVVSAAILDANSSGNILCYDNDNIVNQTPTSSDTISFAAGAFDVSLT